jgi:hypothetical protein
MVIGLIEECFSHGQLHVICSIFRSTRGLHLLAPKGRTRNVVYRDVLCWNLIVKAYVYILKNSNFNIIFVNITMEAL